MVDPEASAGSASDPSDEPPCCGARLRTGGTCALSPVAGRRRCFQHGGARGIGAPKGSRNARKNGLFSAPEIARRRQLNAFYRECRKTLRDLGGR